MTAPEEQLIGQTVGGYEILELVGEGGMGAVYRARQVSLDREVAIKMLARRLSRDEEFIARFIREAKSIAKINHPNILQIYDVNSSEGMHFIAMEFVRGQTMTEMLQEKGYLEWQDCAAFIRQGAMGLAAAADANIIHRDIKPDNLMISDTGIVKVSDFGLAKEMVSQTELTQTGDIMGTPAYMSPEQCDGTTLDTRTDIYSLGCAFYRAVTGVLPFNAPTPVAMMYKHKHEEAIPPRQYMPQLPEQVESIILRMMAKNPNQRFSTMTAVADAIDSTLKGNYISNIDSTTKLSMDDIKSIPPASPHPTPSSPAIGTLDMSAPLGLDAFGVETASSGGDYDEYIAKGDALFDQGRPVAACEYWRRALGIKPNDSAARERLEKAKNDSTVQCLQIGEGLLEQGKLSQLRAELNRVLQADPDNIDAQERLAAIEFMDRRKHDALLEIRKLLSSQQHEKALELWDTLHPGLQDKALAGTMENLRNRVIPCRKKAKEAQDLAAKGRFDESFSKWDEAIGLDPTNDQAKLGKQETERLYNGMESAMREGYDFHIQRKHEAAVSCFDKVLSICPSHAQAKKYKKEALEEMASIAESEHNYEESIKRWKEVLKTVPNDKKVMTRLESATRKRNTLESSLQDAREHMSKGKYRRSTAMFRKALEIQPDNKNALYGIQEARNRFIKKRLLPVLIVTAIAVSATCSILYFQFNDYMTRADFSAQNNTAKDYDKAIANYNKAAAVPIFGQLKSSSIENSIATCKAQKAIVVENNLYKSKDLDKLSSEFDEFSQKIRENEWAIGKNNAATAIFNAKWHIAYLLAKVGKYEDAIATYKEAEKIGQENNIGYTDPKQANIYRSLQDYLTAIEIQKRSDVDATQRESMIIAHLKQSASLWPEFEKPQTLLTGIIARQKVIRSRLESATKWMEEARNAASLENHTDAKQGFDRAYKAAVEVLKLDNENWVARKIKAEIEWRRLAGQDMVFFIYPVVGDSQMKRKFRAFALDRYEWPNKPGIIPEKASFTDAVHLAKEIGKDLPFLDEWQWASANGEKKTTYSFGNKFDRTKCNANGKIGAIKKSGTKEYRSPTGLYDMTGNLAEWVRRIHRDPDSTDQYTIGGSFDSTAEECRNDRPKLKDARIIHNQVGFRAALRWELSR